VKPYPETPPLDEARNLTGHLWIQELPTGGRFRFQVAASGLITFATTDQTFDAVATVPPPYRRAAEAIEAQFDRDAFQRATDDPEQVTFFGLATRNEGVTYDWSALPAFVGIDVWSGNRGGYLTPDAATSVFDRLGLTTLPAVEKEVPATHTDLGRYEHADAFPPSQWRDGDAAGVIIRDKSDGRVQAWRSGTTNVTIDTETGTGAELAAEYATDQRIKRTVEELRENEQSPTVDAIRNHLIADIARESYGQLYPDGEFVASTREFEAAVAERVQQQQFNPE
jgi:hypothetical protein